MSSLNKAQIIGRLGQSPEVRSTQSGTKVANFSVATSERYKDKNGEQQESVEWHKCVSFGRLAEIIEQYLDKGSLIYAEGPLQTRSWEDKDGVTKYTTEIKVLNMTMLGGKGDGSGSNNSNNSKPAANKNAGGVDLNDEGIDDLDSDLPF